jgi:hypothetical protein
MAILLDIFDIFDILVAAIGVATHTAAATPPPPCYVVVTAIVSTANPYTIHRVVTTGIRRYEDTGNGSPSYCTPSDDTRAARALTAVDMRLRDSTVTGDVEHVVVRTTSPDVAGAHLVQIVAKARATPADFKRVEVVSVKDARGTEQDSIPMPALSHDANARAACAADNAALQRTRVSFAWAC